MVDKNARDRMNDLIANKLMELDKQIKESSDIQLSKISVVVLRIFNQRGPVKSIAEMAMEIHKEKMNKYMYSCSQLNMGSR